MIFTVIVFFPDNKLYLDTILERSFSDFLKKESKKLKTTEQLHKDGEKRDFVEIVYRDVLSSFQNQRKLKIFTKYAILYYIRVKVFSRNSFQFQAIHIAIYRF